MQQVSPSTSLRLVYLIQDHTDTNTYYVRSVVRDSVTGAILATINLTDSGNRRFYGTYNTPATEDMYIDITTTVYSDSGYTTKAQDKYEDIDQYLVKTQWGLQFGGLGGGDRRTSEKIDYKLIKKLLKEVLDEEDDEPEEKYDDSKVCSKLDTVLGIVSNIKPQDLSSLKPKEVNLTPVLKAIKEIDIPKIDYQIIIDGISTIKESISSILENKEVHKTIDFDSLIKNIGESEKILSNLIDIAKSQDKLNKIISENPQKEEEKPVVDSLRIKRLIKR